jgi:hypothetical protein
MFMCTSFFVAGERATSWAPYISSFLMLYFPDVVHPRLASASSQQSDSYLSNLESSPNGSNASPERQCAPCPSHPIVQRVCGYQKSHARSQNTATCATHLGKTGTCVCRSVFHPGQFSAAASAVVVVRRRSARRPATFAHKL